MSSNIYKNIKKKDWEAIKVNQNTPRVWKNEVPPFEFDSWGGPGAFRIGLMGEFHVRGTFVGCWHSGATTVHLHAVCTPALA